MPWSALLLGCALVWFAVAFATRMFRPAYFWVALIATPLVIAAALFVTLFGALFYACNVHGSCP